MKILIIQQKMIGDVLTSGLLCENLKRWNPDVCIHFVANDFTLAVVQNNPNIDQLIEFKSSYQSDYISFYRFLNGFKNEHYDYVIDVYGKIESTLITIFSKAKIKIGYAKSFNQFFYTKTIKPHKEANNNLPLAIENRLRLLEPIVGTTFDFVHQPKIYLSKEEIETSKAELKPLLSKKKKRIMVAITGSQDSKTYPMAYMARVLEVIGSSQKNSIVLNYLPEQQQWVEDCLSLVCDEARENIIEDKYPNSLRNYMQWVVHCDAVIGNEGGTINMAKALSKPTFAIFSPQINFDAWHSPKTTMHQAVHLKTYCPKYFQTDQKQDIKTLYKKFLPNFFIPQLKNFLSELK